MRVSISFDGTMDNGKGLPFIATLREVYIQNNPYFENCINFVEYFENSGGGTIATRI